MDSKGLPLENRLLESFQKCIRGFGEFKRIDKINNEVKAFRKDPVFSSLGLYDKKFVKARVRGSFVMSVTRKLGDLFQECVKEIVKSQLGLSNNQIGYRTRIHERLRGLDVIIRLSDLSGPDRRHIERIIRRENRETFTSKPHDAIGLEVRYSYQIGDSKRIQADEDMAEHLNKESILPVMPIFSERYLENPVERLRRSWKVKVGNESFSFLKDLTGFDFLQFLSDNENKFKGETFQVLEEVERRIG